MPEISRFYGIIIYMFAKDHNPPHIHAKYNEYIAVVDIESGRIIKGELPKRAERLINEWREEHISELIDNWKEGQSNSPEFKKIKPLK